MTHCLTPTLQDYHCQVIFNQECGRELKWLRLKLVNADMKAKAGQFVMLDLPDSRFFFRRPFSILDVPEPGVFDLYYKRVGVGTDMMWKLQPNETVQCLGPLGVGFNPPQNPATALYIGGGIGIAPLYFHAKQINQKYTPHPNPPPQGGRGLQSLLSDAKKAGLCFYGVRTQAELGLEKELNSLFRDGLRIATDDGSQGFSGNVCQLLLQNTEQVQTAQDAFICGPMRMMEATVACLTQLNPQLNIQVSLESHMPCGTGACTGCVVPRADRILPAKVCWEGPVFNATVIDWSVH